MLFWILVALLTALAAASILVPLLRGSGTALQPAGHAHDAAVYRDQLRELERDKQGGLISGEEAEFARAEVARRLLAASETSARETAAPARTSRNRWAQALVIVALPAIGLALYLETGSPGFSDQPLAARLENPGNDLNLYIARAETHLANNPNDGKGWDLLAPIYFRNGRLEDSAAAFERAIRLLGPSPDRLGGFAETLIALSGGLVTADAQSALRKAETIAPGDPRVAFYLALALKQEGKNAESIAAFNALRAKSPPDAPWIVAIDQQIASIDGKPDDPAAAASESAEAPGNPSAEDIAAAQSMAPADQQEMIKGMVSGLSERLKENPDNFDGWVRLIRSYVVLNQRDEAAEALKQGLAAFPATGAQGQELLAMATQLGVPTGATGAAAEAPGNPSAEEIAAAQSMAPADQQEMIKGMVAGLSERLKENPDNFDGWVRLIRSYVVLKQPEAAAEALKQGLAAFPATGAQGQELLAMATQLGVPAPATGETP